MKGWGAKVADKIFIELRLMQRFHAEQKVAIAVEDIAWFQPYEFSHCVIMTKREEKFYTILTYEDVKKYLEEGP